MGCGKKYRDVRQAHDEKQAATVKPTAAREEGKPRGSGVEQGWQMRR